MTDSDLDTPDEPKKSGQPPLKQQSGTDGPAGAESADLRFASPRETSDRRLVYRRTDTLAVARIASGGWRRDLDRLCDLAARDAVDRDLRVVFLIGRGDDRDTARRVAAGLVERPPFERIEGGPGLATVRVAELLEAIDAAGDAEPGEERIFVDTISAGAVDAPLIAAWRRAVRGELLGGDENVADLLAARHARLVVRIAADPGQGLDRILAAVPEAVLIPWTDAWLAHIAEKRNLGEVDLQREVGAGLREAAEVSDARHGEREVALHVLLLQFEERDDIFGYTAVVEEIRAIVEKSRQGLPSIGEEARKRFDSIIESDDDRRWGGPIGRTILSVALLVADQPALAVVELSRRLLPAGPVHSDCLTPLLRETWLREVEDDQRLGRPSRPPPGWEVLFDVSHHRVTQTMGLVLRSDRNLVPGPVLAGIDLRRRLLDQHGRLSELARLVGERLVTTDLPPSLVPTAISLALALHRIDRGYFVLGDLVGLISGMWADDTDLVSPRAAVSPILEKHGLPPLPGIRTIADLRRALEAGGVEAGSEIEARLEAIEDDLGIQAAFHLCAALEVVAVAPEGGDDLCDRLLTAILARIPPASALTVLACLVLYGPRPKPTTLGRGTLRLVADHNRSVFTDRFRSLRGVFARLMNTAVAIAGERPVAVDGWADALFTVADEPEFRVGGRALAIWFDDALSTWEIPAGTRGLLGSPPGSLLAGRMLRLDEDGEASRRIPDLLGRLFLRTPSERLAALTTLAELARGPGDGSSPALRPEDMVRQRLADVFWILVEEIDPGETKRRGLRPERIEAIVWGTLSRHYRLDGIRTTEAATRAIVRLTGTPTPADHCDPRDLLDLYAPAALLFWRFHRWGARPLIPGDDDYETLFATLRRIHAAIAPADHRERVRRALLAMVEVEESLIDHFRARVCPLTEARHVERLTALKSLAVVLVPPTSPLVQIR